MRRLLSPAPLLVFTVCFGLAACGSSDDSDGTAATDPPEVVPTDDVTSTEPPADEEPGDAPIADACALLDQEYLDEELSDVESTFGGALDFQDPLQESPSAFCSWQDAGGGLSISLTVEPTATAETDDHSDRAYNIDVEPVVEPQDGPGTKAVLLIDTAFEDTGGDGFPYGYFFVEGEVAVFVETVGLDAGPDKLRALADEVDSRLTAG